MEDVRQPAPVLLWRGHIDPDQQPSFSCVVNVPWINKVFSHHKSEPSPLPLAHVNQGPSFPENIRPDHSPQTPLNNNVGFWKSVPSRYRNKPDINDRWKLKANHIKVLVASEHNRFSTNSSYSSKRRYGKHTEADAWQGRFLNTHLLGWKGMLSHCSSDSRWFCWWGYRMAGNFPGILCIQRELEKIYTGIWCEASGCCWGSLLMTFKFEGWCGSDRCQKISIAGRKLEINNQQATLNTLAYIKARTISPKGKTWSRS